MKRRRLALRRSHHVYRWRPGRGGPLRSLLTLATRRLLGSAPLQCCRPRTPPSPTRGAGRGVAPPRRRSGLVEVFGAEPDRRHNFQKLEVAWRWESADERLPDDIPYQTGHFRAVPLVVDGTMYAATSHGQVAALRPDTVRSCGSTTRRVSAREADRPTAVDPRNRALDGWREGADLHRHLGQAAALDRHQTGTARPRVR